jgi:hypothetical protein
MLGVGECVGQRPPVLEPEDRILSTIGTGEAKDPEIARRLG